MKKRDWFAYLVLLLMSISVAVLSFIPLVEASFKTTTTIASTALYQGDTLEIAGILRNTSKNTMFINFPGPCQATYIIWNKNGQVFPRNKQEFPCNNIGYERFLMGPSQFQTYRFEYDTQNLTPGKYKLAVMIDGFRVAPIRSFEVFARVDNKVGRGEFCEGLVYKQCQTGLECKHRGEFYLGAGMCLYPYENLPFLDLY